MEWPLDPLLALRIVSVSILVFFPLSKGLFPNIPGLPSLAVFSDSGNRTLFPIQDRVLSSYSVAFRLSFSFSSRRCMSVLSFFHENSWSHPLPLPCESFNLTSFLIFNLSHLRANFLGLLYPKNQTKRKKNLPSTLLFSLSLFFSFLFPLQSSHPVSSPDCLYTVEATYFQGHQGFSAALGLYPASPWGFEWHWPLALALRSHSFPGPALSWSFHSS